MMLAQLAKPTLRTVQLVTVSSAFAFVAWRYLSRTETTKMPIIRPGVINDQAIIKGKTQKEVFEYLANFENIASWDPGCLEGKKNEEGSVRVGTTFDLVTEFKGTKSQMTYTMQKLDPPNEVVLHGESSKIRVIDIIKVLPDPTNPENTIVDYTADLTIKGWKRPFIVFLNSDLNKLGRAAMEGLEKTLNGSSE